jgi:hypothetical protein
MFLSPDGRRLAIIAMSWLQPVVPDVLSGGGPPGPDRCDIHVYELATGQEVATFTWDDVEVRNLAISPDGQPRGHN